MLFEVGIQHEGRSKPVDEFRNHEFDRVVTLCDSAAEECPAWFGKGTRVHHSFIDPARAEGTEAEVMNIFRQIRNQIEEKLTPLLKADA